MYQQISMQTDETKNNFWRRQEKETVSDFEK